MLKKIIGCFLFILIALFLYATFGRKDLTLSKAYVKEKYRLPNSVFIKWNGNEIHYTESGKGFPILMIHGFGGSNRDFYILDSLLNDKYRIIRVDMPGFGLSDFPKQTEKNIDYPKIYDAYFSFLLDTLHLDSCYVMGNSLGGMMAWNLTVTHPSVVKKLILFNSAGYDMKAVMKTANASLFKHKIVQFLLQKGIPKFLTKQGIERVFYNKALHTKDRIQLMNDFWNREGNLQQIISMANSDKYLDAKLIQQIKCPTLIIWGKMDKIIPVKYADKFYHDIKGSQKIVYDSCGHVPMLENPIQVQKDVLKFLENK